MNEQEFPSWKSLMQKWLAGRNFIQGADSLPQRLKSEIPDDTQREQAGSLNRVKQE
jgi:hypothetical protein